MNLLAAIPDLNGRVDAGAGMRGRILDALSEWGRGRAATLHRRSCTALRFLSLRMDLIARIWLVVALAVVLPKIAAPISPVHSVADFAAIALPYLAIIAAPVLGYRVAAGAFPKGLLSAQPRFRFAIYGRWRRVSVLEAHGDPRFGPSGFMVSLLIGLMLNVPFRLLEFVAGIPAMNGHAPAWGQALFLAMAAEVCVMSFLYMACFVMALRTVPLFPRMLALVWAMDIGAQLTIADFVTRAGTLPPDVAGALHGLLEGNVQKVLVSIFVWLPYLLLSDKVNVTYRNRVSA